MSKTKKRTRTKSAKQLRIDAHKYALAAVGIVEAGGNNVGKDVEKIIEANGGERGEPWCGDFVAYCYLLAGSKSVVRLWAAVRYLERLLTKVQLLRNVKRGHVVIYNFDHTGIFHRWINKAAGTFEAIEGNTGDTGAVSDSKNGRDGVKIKQRSLSQVSSYRRVLR